jgi:hypothetical protein
MNFEPTPDATPEATTDHPYRRAPAARAIDPQGARVP